MNVNVNIRIYDDAYYVIWDDVGCFGCFGVFQPTPNFQHVYHGLHGLFDLSECLAFSEVWLQIQK